MQPQYTLPHVKKSLLKTKASSTTASPVEILTIFAIRSWSYTARSESPASLAITAL